jgi:hypothetical protein
VINKKIEFLTNLCILIALLSAKQTKSVRMRPEAAGGCPPLPRARYQVAAFQTVGKDLAKNGTVRPAATT